MRRTVKSAAAESPSQLTGTLALMGFAAEHNLRDVAHALGRRDLAGLGRVEERNQKQPRLRNEIEEQVAGERAQPTVDARHHRKLDLTLQIAALFERMGAQTVEIAPLCRQLIREPKPSRVAEIKKLIEYVVYIADRAAQAFIDEKLSWAKGAVEQSRAATELYHRTKADLAALAESSPEAQERVDLLNHITDETKQILELVSGMARDVVAFIEAVEL